MKNITVAIIDDNETLRSSIESYLELKGNYEIAYSNTSWHKGIRFEHRTPVDIFLIDVHLQRENGIEIIGAIKETYKTAKVIIMTGDTLNKEYLLQAIEEGACSFIYKPFAMAQLETAIKTVLEKGSFLEAGLLTDFMNIVNNRNKEKVNRNKFQFTQREEEILEEVMKGKAYKEIAAELGVSFNTVNFHIKNIYQKVGVNSRYDLIKLIK